MSDNCFKVDMGCDTCNPPSPDRPTPFIFPFVNNNTENQTVPAIIEFTSNLAGAIINYTIISAGKFFRIAPTIAIGGVGAGATATCTINAVGQIISVTIGGAGAGYGANLTTIPSIITPGANNLITFDQLNQQLSIGQPFKNTPVQRLALPPYTGGGVTLASAKIQVKLTYTVKTNGVTDLTGTFLINGTPVATTMTIDDTNATYTTVVHHSGEMNLLFTDYVSYQITSTESKLYDITWVEGNFTVKYI